MYIRGSIPMNAVIIMPMLRRGRGLLSLISLLLCLLSAFLWIISTGRADSFSLSREQQSARQHQLVGRGVSNVVWIYSSAGFCQIGIERWAYFASNEPFIWVWRSRHDRLDQIRTSMNISGWWKGGPNKATWSTSIQFPYALTAVIFAILPLVNLMLHRRRRRRVLEHQCVGCGYDLRATPDRCPECGMVPGRSQTKI